MRDRGEKNEKGAEGLVKLITRGTRDKMMNVGARLGAVTLFPHTQTRALSPSAEPAHALIN